MISGPSGDFLLLKYAKNTDLNRNHGHGEPLGSTDRFNIYAYYKEFTMNYVFKDERMNTDLVNVAWPWSDCAMSETWWLNSNIDGKKSYTTWCRLRLEIHPSWCIPGFDSRSASLSLVYLQWYRKWHWFLFIIVVACLNTYHDRMSQWAATWLVTFNFAKTESLLVCRRINKHHYPLPFMQNC